MEVMCVCSRAFVMISAFSTHKTNEVYNRIDLNRDRVKCQLQTLVATHTNVKTVILLNRNGFRCIGRNIVFFFLFSLSFDSFVRYWIFNLHCQIEIHANIYSITSVIEIKLKYNLYCLRDPDTYLRRKQKTYSFLSLSVSIVALFRFFF